MSFTVHPATVADLPDIVTIYNEAFKNDRLVGMLMRNVPAEVKRAYDLEWYRREFNMSALNGLRFYKAMDGNGKMVGYAKWQYPHSLTSEQEEEKKKLDETKEETLPLPEGADGELYKEFLDPLHEKRRKHVQKENMYCKFSIKFRIFLEILPNSIGWNRSFRPTSNSTTFTDSVYKTYTYLQSTPHTNAMVLALCFSAKVFKTRIGMVQRLTSRLPPLDCSCT